MSSILFTSNCGPDGYRSRFVVISAVISWKRPMRNSIIFMASAISAGLSASSAIAESGLEPPMDLLAAQLRTQGFACDHPDSARLEKDASKPNAKVWIVACKGVHYRMTVVPDLAAKIEKLDN